MTRKILYVVFTPIIFSAVMMLLYVGVSMLLGRPIVQDQVIFGFIVGWVLWQAGVIYFMMRARAIASRSGS